MKRGSYRLFLEDIIDAIGKIESYIDGLEYGEFSANNMAKDAVMRNLEIIGEASRNVPQKVRESHGEISWSKMIGFRNIVAHKYFGVDLEIVWKIINENLPEAKPLVEKLLEQVKGEESAEK